MPGKKDDPYMDDPVQSVGNSEPVNTILLHLGSAIPIWIPSCPATFLALVLFATLVMVNPSEEGIPYSCRPHTKSILEALAFT